MTKSIIKFKDYGFVVDTDGFVNYSEGVYKIELSHEDEFNSSFVAGDEYVIQTLSLVEYEHERMAISGFRSTGRSWFLSAGSNGFLYLDKFETDMSITKERAETIVNEPHRGPLTFFIFGTTNFTYYNSHYDLKTQFIKLLFDTYDKLAKQDMGESP